MSSSPRSWMRAAALTLIAGVAFSAMLGAYTLTGYKWAIRQVPYYINPATPDVSPDAVEAAIRRGADAWSLQSNADIALVYAGRTSGTTVTNNGRNEVFFRPETNGSAIATSYYWWNGAGQLVDSDIKFWDAGFLFFAGTSGCSGGYYIEDIVTHEFGHSLGLRHSTSSAATMYASASRCAQTMRTLDVDDLNGIEALYPPGSSVAPPAAPTSLTVTVTSASSSLSGWRDNATNESQFLVERAALGGSFQLVATLGRDAVSYADSGLTAGTPYTYRVRALNSDGYSGYSNTATVTPQATPAPAPAPAPNAPAAPVLLAPGNGSTVTGKVLGLTWAAAAGATSYDLYWGTSSSPALYKSNLTSLKFNLKPAKTTYYWRVVARNASGATSSTTASFRVQ